MSSIWCTSVIFSGRNRWSRSLLTKLWHRAGELIYPWGKTVTVHCLSIPTESKLLPVALADRYQEKDKPIAAYHDPGDVLICSGKDITSGTSAAIGVTTWLTFQGSTVILHGPSVFSAGQIAELEEDVVGSHHTTLNLSSPRWWHNLFSSSRDAILFLILYFLDRGNSGFHLAFLSITTLTP